MVAINKYTTRDVCGISVLNVDNTEFTDLCIKDCLNRSEKPKLAFSLNGESLSYYYKNKKFRELFNYADYVHADGMSIVNACGFLNGEKLKERVSTTDWFHYIASNSPNHDIKHYFLGGTDNLIDSTIVTLKTQYPNLNIVGYHNGYFSIKYLPTIIDEINKANPDIVWVGMGRPKQEQISMLLLQNIHAAWIKTCGGLFDFISGKHKRAPQWMQKYNLEWLFRLYLEPRRLIKRYLFTNIHCLLIIIKYKLFR